MKSILRISSYFLIVVAALISMLACEKESLVPVDDYYRFDKLSKLKMTTPGKLDYILGFDMQSVPLSVSLVDDQAKSITAPMEAVSFYSNNEPLTSGTFSPTKPGVFNLIGKLAGKVSDTVRVNVWDPSKLSIRISVINNPTGEFLASGTDTLKFKVELLSGTKVIEGSFPLRLYANGVEISKSFATATPSDYLFVARGLGLVSNQVIFKALSPSVLPIIRMPVIFHEINRSVLTAAIIKELTDGMTKAFRNKMNHLNHAKDVNATDIYVEFYPAVTGLAGNRLAVAGLDRATSSKTSFELADAYTDAFNTFWDPTRFLNVWVYPNITGSYANSSWAYYPYVTQALDGLEVLQQKTSPFLPFGIFLNGSHLNREDTDEILAHEVGHILGLAHVFSGNGSEFEGCSSSDPDYCYDTRYYDRGKYQKNLSTSFADRFWRTSCSGERYEANNLMDYYYSYNNSFTREQAKRARHVINYGLWLPTPANGFINGRLNGAAEVVERPANLTYYPPIVCEKPE